MLLTHDRRGTAGRLCQMIDQITAPATESESSGSPVSKLLNAREAAELLAISERTLWTLTDRGEIPAVRIGRSVRYDPREINRRLIDCKSV